MTPQSTIIHPAKLMNFATLINGLEREVELGNVTKKRDGDLSLWTYTQQCVYGNNWNEFSIVARGLITDSDGVVALPFPKFFNLSENKTTIPDLPFECYEKIDGSLIIVYYYNGEWRTATKGSFNSNQAIWAKEFIEKSNYIFPSKNATYLFEYIAPHNRIVIDYGFREDLVLLGMYDNLSGEELSLDSFEYWNYVSKAKKYSFETLEHVSNTASFLSAKEEGFIIRFQNGTRVKIKGDEYCRIHRVISHITPLAVWEMLMKNDNMEFMRSQIPEEFLDDYDRIIELIEKSVNVILVKVEHEYQRTKGLTDKELGLTLDTLDPDIQKLIFPRRKLGFILETKTRETVYRMVRPSANILPGYTPTSSMARIQEDLG